MIRRKEMRISSFVSFPMTNYILCSIQTLYNQSLDKMTYSIYTKTNIDRSVTTNDFLSLSLSHSFAYIWDTNVSRREKNINAVFHLANFDMTNKIYIFCFLRRVIKLDFLDKRLDFAISEAFWYPVSINDNSKRKSRFFLLSTQEMENSLLVFCCWFDYSLE